ncbi:DNA-binding LytR/AlgR family response regulator [Desulfofundulus luciae]|uniref:Stage 0 sporulation protein A homolog n=1 Tax=Desulfofundulus luciae TaxID=74702 RepID=A0ABU0B4B4_9FIRM|nr:LytTR family DNA-binding domain-containing protein [Desulfofundulus luciae]MDQ0287551.1 DNA-binding LytR/AlgR family response regulator [Desulfofundulus luciae]
MTGSVLKIVIADDDEPICNLLSDILGTFEGVAVVGKASNGRNLLKLVKDTGPDAVFLDIQMPGLDGLSAVHQLQRQHPGVFIVFITAYPQYAAEAFNLDAVDYLIKPLNRERIGRTLDKLKRFKEMRTAGGKDHRPYPGPGGSSKSGPDCRTKLTIKSGHGIIVIDTDSIFFVEKVGKKCVIHTDSGLYETSEGLSLLEGRLDPARFFRCHKSFIINIDRVEKVLPYADRAYEVTFRNYPARVTMRREKFEAFCLMIQK